MKRTDLSGMEFGRWEVLAAAPSRRTPGGSTKGYWHCLCACCKRQEVRAEHLISGRSVSCGCHKQEAAVVQKTIHGASETALYGVWVQMLQRCENPKNKRYHRYGGRGISVCESWHEFANFLADNVEHYRVGLTIDREKNDGNYAPGNVRWVSRKVNGRNTSKALRVQWKGDQVLLNELADRYGVVKATLYGRVRVRGIPLERALGVAP